MSMSEARLRANVAEEVRDRRIELLENTLRDLHDVVSSGTKPSEELMERVRAVMARGRRN